MLFFTRLMIVQLVHLQYLPDPNNDPIITSNDEKEKVSIMDLLPELPNKSKILKW